ncbi:hypothetical protein QBC39DRAFT_30385 [Podospora conica]|nr:hypothetical protein QBC39DRAFT_30385 [Schizothecium conicum]
MPSRLDRDSDHEPPRPPTADTGTSDAATLLPEAEIPDHIRSRCRSITERLDEQWDDDVITDVRDLARTCQAQGIWDQLLVEIPYPSRALFEVIATSKSIPRRCRNTVTRLCRQWAIDEDFFYKKFFGASSHAFFEELTRLAFAEPQSPTWTPCWKALSDAREARMRGKVPDCAMAPLWLPSDIHRAADKLGLSVPFKRKYTPKSPGKRGRPRTQKQPLQEEFGNEPDGQSQGSPEPEDMFGEDEASDIEHRRRRDPDPTGFPPASSRGGMQREPFATGRDAVQDRERERKRPKIHNHSPLGEDGVEWSPASHERLFSPTASNPNHDFENPNVAFLGGDDVGAHISPPAFQPLDFHDASHSPGSFSRSQSPDELHDHQVTVQSDQLHIKTGQSTIEPDQPIETFAPSAPVSSASAPLPAVPSKGELVRTGHESTKVPLDEQSNQPTETKGEPGPPLPPLTLHPGSKEVKRLMRPQGWLDDVVIDMALKACVAARSPSKFVAISCLLSSSTSNPENHQRYIKHLAQLPKAGLEALVPLNTGGHWVLAHIQFGSRHVHLYDSLSTERHRDTAAASGLVHSFLVRFLGEDPSQWQVTLCASPQQSDRSSCGLFVIATAFYIAAQLPLPAQPFDPLLWRSVLSCLLSTPREEGHLLWPFTAEDDDAVTKVRLSPTAPMEAYRAFQDGLVSGSLSVMQTKSLLQTITENTNALLDENQERIDKEVAVRRGSLTELRVIECLLGRLRGIEWEEAKTGSGLSSEDIDKERAVVENMRNQLAMYPDLAVPGQLGHLEQKMAEFEALQAQIASEAERKVLVATMLQRLGQPVEKAISAALLSVGSLERASAGSGGKGMIDSM